MNAHDPQLKHGTHLSPGMTPEGDQQRAVQRTLDDAIFQAITGPIAGLDDEPITDVTPPSRDLMIPLSEVIGFLRESDEEVEETVAELETKVPTEFDSPKDRIAYAGDIAYAAGRRDQIQESVARLRGRFLGIVPDDVDAERKQ